MPSPRLAAKEAMYTIKPTTRMKPTKPDPAGRRYAAPRTKRARTTPLMPISSSGLRPSLSMDSSAAPVTRLLTSPMTTVDRRAAEVPRPALSRMVGA